MTSEWQERKWRARRRETTNSRRFIHLERNFSFFPSASSPSLDFIHSRRKVLSRSQRAAINMNRIKNIRSDVNLIQALLGNFFLNKLLVTHSTIADRRDWVLKKGLRAWRHVCSERWFRCCISIQGLPCTCLFREISERKEILTLIAKSSTSWRWNRQKIRFAESIWRQPIRSCRFIHYSSPK